MKIVQLYTDGCALGNPGRGGAGAILVYGEHQKELMQFLPDTTNNRAELQAIILGLNTLTEPCSVQVFSDSQMTVRCARGQYSRSSNLDLWQDYDMASKPHIVDLVWIKKDSHPLNHLAHELANEAARKQIA